ncbi:lantibiotic dehydratase family protein [Flagellimonas flava]|uniref:Lantibiotic dehydratase, C terminus n=1 Tax=Flagellimonas flava TaxID=570519 RepID=A0A1M5LZJ5_9FLAO|nr:lantibiotic dehydratase family protein [Allomuricauda flava]SHG70514.1 Lantibiotic dehydratase, C terminus [Allomuricauda flava]
MTHRCQYEVFPNYVLRTPLLSFDAYKNLTTQKTVSNQDFKDICNDPITREALFLASPSLLMEIDRWLEKGITDRSKIKKLQHSILKYYARMTSRCTPFGIFAGCAIGQFGHETKIEPRGLLAIRRHTRLDMNYLVALSQNLAKNRSIKEQLLYYPNSSLYKAGNQLRYVEYSYVGSKRHHQISAVDGSEFIRKILDKAVKGSSVMELSKLLVTKDISFEEAHAFVYELIDNQILVSELEPSVSGPEFMDQIRSVLSGLEKTDEILSVLNDVHKEFESMNDQLGVCHKKYLGLGNKIKSLETEFESKYLFQVDLEPTFNKNTLSNEVMYDVQKGFTFLNRISLRREDTLLSKFKDAFYDRFEGREVPLAIALDTEMGLGYIQNQDTGDVNPLVDNLVVNAQKKESQARNLKWTTIDSFFQKKLLEAHKTGAYTIKVTDEDFEGYEVIWDDLPDTISCMIELINVDGVKKIKFNGGGGSSAANLIGRFCHGDSKLFEHANKIIEVENQMNKDKIMAEIVHLPESRVGNILMRPDFRKYEIPYLARSIQPSQYQLSIDDLWVSVKGNRLVLRSKKYNAEVIPRLTNAHNYSSNALPIYHFLSDIQNQGNRGGLWLNLDKFTEDFDFFPRIEYENLILLEATWNLKKDHVRELIENQEDDIALIDELKVFKKRMNMPSFVKLLDGDNELLVNLDNLTSVRMLLDIITKRDSFRLSEFLHGKEGVVAMNDTYFTNQIIVSFYNSSKLD